jgi:hypothetical protein
MKNTIKLEQRPNAVGTLSGASNLRKAKIKYYISMFLVFTLLVTGCDKSTLDKTNTNQYTVDQYYANETELTAATNGIYSEFYGNCLWGRMMQYFSDCRADEHRAGGSQIETANAQLFDGSYDNGNYTITIVWKGLYRMVHRANAVIEYGPENTDNISADVLTQRVGEAKFLRAWAYYYLVVNWGKIPIYTKATDDAQPLSEESAVYELLESDLTEIINDLPVSYTTDIGRATKGAAQLLLARVYMHQGKYSDAKTVLEAIYNSTTYQLVDNYADNFMEETEYNKESIFEIGFAGTGGYGWGDDGNSTSARSTIMFQDYSPVGWRNCILSDKLLNDFESTYNGDTKDDPRLHETAYFTGDTYGLSSDPDTLTDAVQNGYSSTFHGQTIKASWKKYSPMYKLDPGSYYQSNINYRNMRFAEVIIKLAECENEIGTQQGAIDYLNKIRDRASVSMPHYPTSNYSCDSKDQVMRAIMHEESVEFSDEKLRVLDLARWRKNNKFSTLNPDPISYIVSDPSKAYLVLPSEETSANANIK